MNLHLLHGAGLTNSRKKLIDLKMKFDPNNVVVFDNGAKVEDVLGELVTIPLLEEDKLIIWENPSEGFVPDSLLIALNSTLILWFDHEIDPKDYPNAKIFFFSEEKEASIFPFLDYLGARDKNAYLELEKRNKTSPNDTQYILTMVFYLLRNLVVTPKKAVDFIRSKNARMRSKFSPQELVSLYKSILEIDFKIKNGLLEIPQAEFSLVNLFTH